LKNRKIKAIASALYETSTKEGFQAELFEFLKLLYKFLKDTSSKRPLKINTSFNFINEIGEYYRSEIRTITNFLFEEYKFLKIPKNLNKLINTLEDIHLIETGTEMVNVETPNVLDEDEKIKIENKLKETLNKKVICNYKINPELIGGIRIQIKDKLLDCSIKGRIERIKRAILEEKS